MQLFLLIQHAVPYTTCACLLPVLDIGDVFSKHICKMDPRSTTSRGDISMTLLRLFHPNAAYEWPQRFQGTDKYRWTQVAYTTRSLPVIGELCFFSACPWWYSRWECLRVVCIFPFLPAPSLHACTDWVSESSQVQSETIALKNSAKKCHFYVTLLYRDNLL